MAASGTAGSVSFGAPSRSKGSFDLLIDGVSFVLLGWGKEFVGQENGLCLSFGLPKLKELWSRGPHWAAARKSGCAVAEENLASLWGGGAICRLRNPFLKPRFPLWRAFGGSSAMPVPGRIQGFEKIFSVNGHRASQATEGGLFRATKNAKN